MNIEKKINLRSQPMDYTSRDLHELQQVIRQYNLFCKGYEWNQDFCHDQGQPVHDFINHPDGTLTDRSTGLMWQKDHRPAYGRWQEAVEYIQELNRQRYGGYTDWRLPTIEECCSLFTREKENDGLYISPWFSNRMWLWTSDIKDKKNDLVWNANFLYGSVFWIDAGNGQDMRAVRTAVNSEGRQLLLDMWQDLQTADIDAIIDRYYHPQAQVITFGGVFQGKDQIRLHFSKIFPVIRLGIRQLDLQKYTESEHCLAYSLKYTTPGQTVIPADEMLFLDQGKIYRQVIQTLPTPSSYPREIGWEASLIGHWTVCDVTDLFKDTTAEDIPRIMTTFENDQTKFSTGLHAAVTAIDVHLHANGRMTMSLRQSLQPSMPATMNLSAEIRWSCREELMTTQAIPEKLQLKLEYDPAADLSADKIAEFSKQIPQSERNMLTQMKQAPLWTKPNQVQVIYTSAQYFLSKSTSGVFMLHQRKQ
jgi:serine/threonine-protein kinase